MSNLPIIPKLQAFEKKIEEVQEKLKKEEIKANVVGGAVEIIGNANFEVKNIKIDPSFYNNLDQPAMTEFVGSAIKQFIKKAQKTNGQIVSKNFGWFGEFLKTTLVEDENE